MKFKQIMFLFYLLYVNLYTLAKANDATTFINRLKKHYKHTESIKVFSLTHSYLGRSEPYQSWDFQAPSRYQAFKITDIDLEKQHYYQNVVHHYTGGLFFDEVHFQNDVESLRYERNGISLGKGAIKQNMNSFTRYKNLTLMNLDFFAVKPLLKESDIKNNIDLHLNGKTGDATLTHRFAKNKIMEYVFHISPLRLKSINNKARNRIYFYGDYRTNNGFHFAHSLIKHYNSELIPSFITRIEKFELLNTIDQEKLTLPPNYYKIPPEQNHALATTQLAKNLYLVADSSATNNIILKVSGNDIMVFGVPSTNKLSTQAINIIKKQFPEKIIHGVFITHPYSDHIVGLLPFVEQGAKIYADAYTIKAIKAYPRFTKVIENFSFQTITHEQEIDEVRFYVLENSRSKRQSFAYFKRSEIIFQSDFLEIAFDNTIANILPSYSNRFIDFIRHKQLKVKRIVGNHGNNNISLELINKAYNANTK